MIHLTSDSRLDHRLLSVGGPEPEIKLRIGNSARRRAVTKKLVIHCQLVSVGRLQVGGEVSNEKRSKVIRDRNIRSDVRLGKAGNLCVAKRAGKEPKSQQR